MMSAKPAHRIDPGYTSVAKRLRSHGHVGGETGAVILLCAGLPGIDTSPLAAGVADALGSSLAGPVALVHRGPAQPGAALRVGAEDMIRLPRDVRRARLDELRQSARAVIIDGGPLDDDATVSLGAFADKRLAVVDLRHTTQANLASLRHELELHVLTFDGFLAVGHRDILPGWARKMVS